MGGTIMKYVVDSKMSINKTLHKCNPGDIIFLKNGIYNEKVEVRVNNISIIGESKEYTIIANKDFYHKIMPDYNECNTFRTYTMYIGSDNVTLSNLTVRNDSIPSSKYGQAVALHVQGDKFKCENCGLYSAQDTLFTGPLPTDLCVRHQGFLAPDFISGVPSKQEYNFCDIQGDVDFIFGGATALFKECTLTVIKNDNINDSKSYGYVAAPSHSKDTKYGFLFYKCKIKSENTSKRIYLARPWRDYGSTAFIECELTQDIIPQGFHKWNNTNRDKTARFYEYSPSIDLSMRESWVKQLNEAEANKFLQDFINYLKY